MVQGHCPGDPLVAREERRRLVVDHHSLLPIEKNISEPAKSCAANATGLQSQEQVLMQNIVKINAFDRSMKTAVMYCFLSRAWSQSSRVARRRSEQECEARNLN